MSPEGELRGDRNRPRRKGPLGRPGAKRASFLVPELLRGANPESTSRKFGATAGTPREWRDLFLAAGAEGPKVRQKTRSTRRTGVSGKSSWWPWRARSGGSVSCGWGDSRRFCGGARATAAAPAGLRS